MNNYVADTMAIVLYLEKRKLPKEVKFIFNNAEEGKSVISFSTISLMEIGYLFEKKRIDTTIQDVINLTKRYNNFTIHALDENVVLEAFRIKNIPELHDRLITATAAFLKAELITNDPLIHNSQYVKVVW